MRLNADERHERRGLIRAHVARIPRSQLDRDQEFLLVNIQLNLGRQRAAFTGSRFKLRECQQCRVLKLVNYDLEDRWQQPHPVRGLPPGPPRSFGFGARAAQSSPPVASP